MKPPLGSTFSKLLAIVSKSPVPLPTVDTICVPLASLETVGFPITASQDAPIATTNEDISCGEY